MGFLDPETGEPLFPDEVNPNRPMSMVDRSYIDPDTREVLTYQVEGPAPTPEPADDLTDSTTLFDYGKSIMAGGAGVGAGLGWLIKKVAPGDSGLEDFGQAIETYGNDAVDYWNDSMSPAAQSELAKEFITKDENGEYHWGDASLTTVGLFGAQSLLGTAAGAGLGAGATKVLQVFGNPIGRGALSNTVVQTAERLGITGKTADKIGAVAGIVANQPDLLKKAELAAFKKLKFVDTMLGALGFGVGEGSIGGMMTGVNIEAEIMRLDDDKLMSSPRFMQIFDASEGLMDEAKRMAYARETLAKELSTVGAFQSGALTALLGAPMGAYFGPMFSKVGMGRTGGVLKGAAGEAAQEFGQSAGEALVTNKELIKAGDTRGLWDDVLNQAIGGAAAGGLIGGGFGLSLKGNQQSAPKKKDGKTPPPGGTVNIEPLRKLGEEALAAGVGPEELVPIVKAANEPGGMMPALRAIRELIAAKGEQSDIDAALGEVDENRPAKRGKRRRKSQPELLDEYEAGRKPQSESPEPQQKVESNVPAQGKGFNPSRDSILQAISKLGGLSTEEAVAQGIDPASMAERGYGIKRVFTKTGVSFDEMAERLSEHGYPVTDESGQIDLNELLSHVTDELAGNKVYTSAGIEAQMEIEAEQAAVEEQGAPGAQPRTMAELTELASNVDEGATERVLEKAESDADAARQLNEIIDSPVAPPELTSDISTKSEEKPEAPLVAEAKPDIDEDYSESQQAVIQAFESGTPAAADTVIDKWTEKVKAENDPARKKELGNKRGLLLQLYEEMGEVLDRPDTAIESSVADAPAIPAPEPKISSGGSALSVKFGDQTYPVESYADASAKWNQFRQETGAGASELPRATIVDASGNEVAKIAYNGKVTETMPEKPAIESKAEPKQPVAKPEKAPEAEEAPAKKAKTDGFDLERLIEARDVAEGEGRELIESAIRKIEQGEDASEDLNEASYYFFSNGLALEDVLDELIDTYEIPTEQAPEGFRFIPEIAGAEPLTESRTSEVFPDPGKKTNIETVAKKAGELSLDEAKQVVDGWKAEAKRIGREFDNSKKVIISMYDNSGEWSKPWRDAGYTVVQIDKELGHDIVDMHESPTAFLGNIEAAYGKIHGILSACPCTSFAGSGARWWSSQHDNPSLDMVRKKYGDTAAEHYDTPVDFAVLLVRMTELYVELSGPEFHVLENPVGRIAEKAGLPQPTAQFQPHNFGDPYTKRTQLWGKFNPNLPTANVDPIDGSKMQSKMSSGDPRRSLTPEGFAYSFFMANDPNAKQTISQAEIAEGPVVGSDIKSTQDFGDLEISEDVEVEETGQTFTSTEKANVVFRRAVKRRDSLQKLLGCMNA